MAKLMPPDAEGERLERREEDLSCHGLLTVPKENEEDEETCWNLQTINMGPAGVVACTISFEAEQDREWAIKTWHSLKLTEIEDVDMDSDE